MNNEMLTTNALQQPVAAATFKAYDKWMEMKDVMYPPFPVGGDKWDEFTVLAGVVAAV